MTCARRGLRQLVALLLLHVLAQLGLAGEYVLDMAKGYSLSVFGKAAF